MIKIKIKNNKIFSFIPAGLAAIFYCVNFFLFFPSQLSASPAVPVVDPVANSTLHNIDASSNNIEANIKALKDKDVGPTIAGIPVGGSFDSIAWTLANVMIDNFGDSVVDWIKTGFDGSPQFLSDPEGFFRDTANDASGALINSLGLNWLCEDLPKLNINIDFFFPGTIRTKYKCTFDDIVDNFSNIAGRDDLDDWLSVNVNTHETNVVTEFGNDFRNGGFLMWFLTADEKNNSLGKTLQLTQDITMAANASVQMGQFNLQLNSGFFGVEECLEWSTPVSGEEKKCLKSKINSPGTLVQDQLNKASNSDLDRLMIADEVDEVIAALASTMIGWMLTGGGEEEGVLGFDTSADDLDTVRGVQFGDDGAKDRQKEQLTLSQQVDVIQNNEADYIGALNRYNGALTDTQTELETTLATLQCVKSVNNAVTGDEGVCDLVDDAIRDIKLSAIGKTEAGLDADIAKTDNQLTAVKSSVDKFNSAYGQETFSISARAMELFAEFMTKVLKTDKSSAIAGIINDYCYRYHQANGTGEICGLFGSDIGSDKILAAYIVGENNPVTADSSGQLKTRIYWKAVNAESCETNQGDSTWQKTPIVTGGNLATEDFTTGEEKIYGLSCNDSSSNGLSAQVAISSESAKPVQLSGYLFANANIVKHKDSANLYWLTVNANQCYLFSDQDTFNGEGTPLSGGSTEKWFKGEGFYLPINKMNTTGYVAEEVPAGGAYNYKLICAGSDDVYNELAALEITTQEGEEQTYTTHSAAQAEAISKKTSLAEIKMEDISTEFACLLDEYTLSGAIDQEECEQFNLPLLP